MFQYKRLNMMFHHISKNEYTPVSNLQSLLNISDRTIRNDIQEINSILSAYGAMVKLKRNYGYYIEVSDDKKYSEFLNTFKQHDNKRMNIDSSTERIKYILNVLLSSDDYISLVPRNKFENYMPNIFYPLILMNMLLLLLKKNVLFLIKLIWIG